MNLVILALIATVLSLGTQDAQAAYGSPSSAKITIYGVALSTNTDCSNAKVVGYNPAGTTYDLTTNPSLVNGNVDPGTYQCMILYMQDTLEFVPAATVGNCTAGTTYKRVICSGSCTTTGGSPDANNILQYTAATTSLASNSQDLGNAQKVFLFLSTGTTGNGQTGGAFTQPTAGTSGNGITLSSPFTVSGSGGSATFVVNFNGALNGGASPCDLGPPTFGFR